MRHSPVRTHRNAWRIAGLIAVWGTLAGLSGCIPGALNRESSRSDSSAPVLDRATASAAVLASHLELLQKLVQSGPAEQAEIIVATQREYDLAPTPSHQLRYALALAVPGHAGTDLPRAQRLLQELMATPETLLPAERALAFLELQKVDAQMTLTAENRRLQSTMARNDRERMAAVNKRLQMEIEENARLRKELDEVRAKLDAITEIERSITERKPTTPEGRSP
ncbi:MAG TPA: hypothetical protein VIL32_18220 [Steroidobacteraceae bacterium]